MMPKFRRYESDESYLLLVRGHHACPGAYKCYICIQDLRRLSFIWIRRI